MATIESIQNAYIDYVLTEGSEPKSVYIFAKQNEMTEAEFYQFYGSFEAVEQAIWASLAHKTLAEIRARKFGHNTRHAKKDYHFFTDFSNC
jgi:hypothetical protein